MSGWQAFAVCGALVIVLLSSLGGPLDVVTAVFMLIALGGLAFIFGHQALVRQRRRRR